MIASPTDVLYRIKRGLSGYVSYLAACEMNEAFSEYVLYEPILRILTARGYTVHCEFACDGLGVQGSGDHMKIDFEASAADGHRFALEVKWARQRHIDVERDHMKLAWFHDQFPGSRSFLCVFGRKSHVEHIVLKKGNFTNKGKFVHADFGVTKFGCRTYELAKA